MREQLVDCKIALRLYLRTPVSSLIAVVVLAVGIACVSALLSLYVDLVLKPFRGIQSPDELVTVASVDGSTMRFDLAEQMSQEVTSLEKVVSIFFRPNFPIGRDGERVTIEFAVRGFFDSIRPKLALGRGFEPGEHDRYAEPVVVISNRYWREHYAGRPSVLGETIELVGPQWSDGGAAPAEFRIVGVMAPGFRGMTHDDVDIWAPLERIVEFLEPGGYEKALAGLYVLNFGRLRPGATVATAAREIETRYDEYKKARNIPASSRIEVAKGVVRDIAVYRDAERQLRLFLAGSILLALVAAANTSLFLLARAPGRRRELAIRMSLGAPLTRLARQMLTEASLVVAAGALLGVLVSVWLASFVRSQAFLNGVTWSDVTLLDWRVLGLVALFLGTVTLLVSLAPILALEHVTLAPFTRLGAVRATLWQRLAGTVQIATAGVLGGAAIAFVWFLVPIVFGDPGYRTDNRYAVRFFSSAFLARLSGRTTPPPVESAAINAAHERELIEGLPGVSGVTLSALVPGWQQSLEKRQVPDPVDPSRGFTIVYAQIDSQFVGVMGLRLLRGRVPADDETGASLVNRTLARHLFGRDDVVGERLEISGAEQPSTEIVGVLEDLSFLHPASEVDPALFRILPPSPIVATGVIESSLKAAELQRQLQDRFDSGELQLGWADVVRPLGEIREDEIAPDRARGLLTLGTAILVVVLAAFGFYGIQHYLVNAARHEYAIRVSLGATPAALVRLVVRRGLVLGLPGLVLGAPLAFIAVAWLRDHFLSRQISPGAVTIGVVFGLTLLMLAASLGPAHLARRADPVAALRDD
ncbi:MAG TPA: ABC transporter permease [Gammaproteobacteria bacterium]|nr:ABC transporter permease [Gammaproteobacteria bacterium]